MENKIKAGVLAFGMSGKLFHVPFLDVHYGVDLCAIIERTKKVTKLTYPDIIIFR